MALHRLGKDLELGRELLGGKAWGITEMLRQGISVPPACAITTDECHRYAKAGGEISAAVVAALPDALNWIGDAVGGRRFGGGAAAPLLVSVRSGAPISMPGMMDTILNLGINDQVEAALATAAGAAYAADTHQRFRDQYAKVVGSAAPADPDAQLRGAIAAVFESWNSDRAVAYRAQRGIASDLGTAVTIQAMVFGNLDERSGTGVLFSRDPLSASPQPYGEWLGGGQGEDIVSGEYDPEPLAAMAAALPKQHAELLEYARRLDAAADHAQDIEFTVESGRLWLLQCRNARVMEASGQAIATAETATAELLGEGRPASPGIVNGTVVSDMVEAEMRALEGEQIILARPTTSPHDVRAMAVVAGIITEIGGATSHAAVVSRELGVACVVGLGAGASERLAGREVTLDADAGRVYAGWLQLD